MRVLALCAASASLARGEEAGALGRPAPPPGDPPDPPAASAGETARTLPAGAAVEIVTIDGRESIPIADAARLAMAGGEGGTGRRLILDASRIPVEDVLFIRLPAGPPPPAAPFLLLLRSGAEIAGAVAGGDEASIRFRAPVLGPEPRSIRIEDVKGLIVERAAPPGAAAARESAIRQRIRRQIAGAKLEKDEVLLLEGGRIEGVLDRFEEDGVRFGSDSLGDVKVAHGKVRAVALADVGDRPPPEGAPPAGVPEARVSLRGGTSFTAAVTALAAGRLSLHEPVLGPIEVGLEDVLDIALRSGRCTYLSDREPVEVVERLGPAFRKTMPHRRDENVLGEPIRMGGREHRKGLGVHSYSLLRYDIGGEFTRFQAVIGLDDSAQPIEAEPALAGFAEVVFRVRVDGNLALEKKMSWRDPPLAIDVPLAGGRILSLEVDYGAPEGGFNFALDRADWADARIVR